MHINDIHYKQQRDNDDGGSPAPTQPAEMPHAVPKLFAGSVGQKHTGSDVDRPRHLNDMRHPIMPKITPRASSRPDTTSEEPEVVEIDDEDDEMVEKEPEPRKQQSARKQSLEERVDDCGGAGQKPPHDAKYYSNEGQRILERSLESTPKSQSSENAPTAKQRRSGSDVCAAVCYKCSKAFTIRSDTYVIMLRSQNFGFFYPLT